MSDIVIPEGDYVEIVKPICINPFGDYFINIKRGSRLSLPVDDENKDVDWEQRRFDLVKAYSIEFIKMQDRKGEIDCGVYVPDVVSWSITIADRIIGAMRGVKNA